MPRCPDAQCPRFIFKKSITTTYNGIVLSYAWIVGSAVARVLPHMTTHGVDNPPFNHTHAAVESGKRAWI